MCEVSAFFLLNSLVERTQGKLWDPKNVALKCENAIITESEQQQNVKGAKPKTSRFQEGT